MEHSKIRKNLEFISENPEDLATLDLSQNA
jgi:hypothetical protein